MGKQENAGEMEARRAGENRGVVQEVRGEVCLSSSVQFYKCPDSPSLASAELATPHPGCCCQDPPGHCVDGDRDQDCAWLYIWFYLIPGSWTGPGAAELRSLEIATRTPPLRLSGSGPDPGGSIGDS